MASSRFLWTIFIWIVVILMTSVALGVYAQKPGYPFTVSLLSILLVLETLSLFYHIIRIRRDLEKLVNALLNEDTAMQFSRSGKDPYFRSIHRGFNELIRNFRLVRLDGEARQTLFEATVNHVPFGLMAFDRKGKVLISNRAFTDLFRTGPLEETGELHEEIPGLADILHQMQDRQESLHQFRVQGTNLQVILFASRLRLLEEEITLISARDISHQLNLAEVEAWQKLLRVLRHEILNSISPIRLLSANLREILFPGGERKEWPNLTPEKGSEVLEGLEAIHRRASGLSNFLEAYSNLYRIPELEMAPVQVGTLFRRMEQLFREPLEESGTVLTISMDDPEMTLSLDEQWIEQVLINILKNAMEATGRTEHPQIQLKATEDEKDRVLLVSDNGPGIPPEILENVFTPFFSTKEQGSGIGLSFSQHIMKLHGGRIRVISGPGEGCTVQLRFLPSSDGG